jgi:hypothetical protein
MFNSMLLEECFSCISNENETGRRSNDNIKFIVFGNRCESYHDELKYVRNSKDCDPESGI